MKLLLMVVVGMVVMLQLPSEGSAECCQASADPITPFVVVPVCGDCTEGTPYCAYGPCNIFGCNCDGGCRSGSCHSGRRSLLSARDVIARGDLDGDGRMSLEEARAHLVDMEFPADRVKRDLLGMDVNKDGFLSNLEIDRRTLGH